jgi:ATP synthase protein I
MKYHKEFFLSSMVPALIVGTLGLVIATVLSGRTGFVAGIFAVLLVFFFLVVHLLVSLAAPRVSPIATMGLAMASYFLKIIAVVLCLFLLEPIDMNKRAFGIIAIATTTTWLAGEIWAYSTAWTRRKPRRP